MGKGDKKTKKGKIIMGSTGVIRPRKKKKPVIAKSAKKAEKAEKVADTEEKKTAKKPAAKKPKKESTETAE